MDVQIEESWKTVLQDEFEKPYFNALVATLKAEKKSGKIIYPPGPSIFNAFKATPFDQVKVVILGQDPYHNPGQAHGLCFSVPDGVPLPPSLINIYKEIQQELDIPIPTTGNLTAWANQGVFLLNAVLTVRAGEAASHAKIGWMDFTDAVIEKFSKNLSGIIFLLWGKFAQSKESLIDKKKHFILKAAHPSPLSAFNGFFGCGHFKETNRLLKTMDKTPINWAITTNKM